MARNFSSGGAPGKAGGGGLPPGAQSFGVRPCPNCRADVNVNATVCAACGERMPVQNRTIRCRRCRQRTNASLVVCPHCGRDLYPARSRWLTWGAPLAAIVLVGLLVLVRGARSNPVAWAQARVAGVSAFMGSISEQLDPEVNIVFVPPDANLDNPLASQAALAVQQPTTELLLPSSMEPEAINTPQEQPALTASEIAATPVVEATVALATDTPTPPPTASTTATIAPTEDAALTLATPTPPGDLYLVQRGDTVFDIAIRYGLSEEELLAANGLSKQDAFTLQPGQELIIPSDATATPAETPTETATETPAPTATLTVTPAPSATQTPAATPAPAATAPAQAYTVRAGDTLAAIAIRNGVTIDSILTTNNLTLAAGRRLTPGQQLLIPQRPAQNSLSLPTATPTALSTMRLAAPELRAPDDGATLSCQSDAALTWQPMPGIRVNDFYVVHLGYVGAEDTVVWVAQPQRAANVTAWDIDVALCDLPPATANGEWRWWVEVVTGGGTAQEPVSPPSETRSFVWQ